jgi:hypothetical protein
VNKKHELNITEADELLVEKMSLVFGAAVKNADVIHKIWNINYGLQGNMEGIREKSELLKS